MVFHSVLRRFVFSVSLAAFGKWLQGMPSRALSRWASKCCADSCNLQISALYGNAPSGQNTASLEKNFLSPIEAKSVKGVRIAVTRLVSGKTDCNSKER
jgi:hypothetical protein